MPFISDADLQAALTKANTPAPVASAALEVNKQARVAGLRAAIAALALIVVLALFLYQSHPDAFAGTIGGISQQSASMAMAHQWPTNINGPPTALRQPYDPGSAAGNSGGPRLGAGRFEAIPSISCGRS